MLIIFIKVFDFFLNILLILAPAHLPLHLPSVLALAVLRITPGAGATVARRKRPATFKGDVELVGHIVLTRRMLGSFHSLPARSKPAGAAPAAFAV